VKIYPLGTFPEECEWFMERNPVDISNGMRGVVAHDGTKIQGIIVMDTWTENSCQVHIAIDSPFCIRSGLVSEAFRYIFETTGRGIVYGITPADNSKALRFNAKVGFVEVCRLKGAYKVGVDLVLQEVRQENYYAKRAA